MLNPPMYRFIISFERLLIFYFHILRDRFTMAIFDPVMYWFIIFPMCLPTVEFHIFWDRFTTAKFDPPSYWFTRIPGCLPTLVLKFVWYRTFIMFNKDPYFKFITTNPINYRTHLNLSLKK